LYVDQLTKELAASPIRNSARARRALSEAMAGVRSHAEARMRTVMKAAELPEPCREHEIYDRSGRLIGIPDCLWRKQRVIAEMDARTFHFLVKDWEKTMARRNEFTGLGFRAFAYSLQQLEEAPASVRRSSKPRS